MKSDSTVLVTGGRGFIGRSVCRLLKQDGYRVLSLDQVQDEFQHPSLAKPDRGFQCDIADAAQVRGCLEAEPVDAVIHLAAVLPTAAQCDPTLGTRVNIGGGLNVLETARQRGVRRFVFASSLSVYGTHSAEQNISEEHRAVPEDLYGVAKLYIERLGEILHSEHAVEFVSLRIGRVVGAGARSQSSAWRSRIFEEIRTTKPREIVVPFNPAERLLLVHVDDVAKMLVMLLRKNQPTHTLYNACCESVRVADLKQEIELLNANVTVRLGAGEAIGNPRLLDCSRFEREFGFVPVPIFEQLKQAAGRKVAF